MQASSLLFNQYSCIISRSSPKFAGESKFKHERTAEVAHHSEKQAPSQSITSTQLGSLKFAGESKFKHERTAEVAHHSEKQAPSQSITSSQLGSLKFDGESEFKHKRAIRQAHHSENESEMKVFQNALNRFLLLDYQGKSKVYKFIDVPGDGNCLFHALCKSELFIEYDHLHLRQKYIRDMRSFRVRDPQKYRAFAEFILKNHGSTLELRLAKIAHEPNSWGSWIEASAMMIIWNLDIIFHTPARNEDGLFYSVTNSKHSLVKVLPPETITGEQIHLLYHRHKLPYDFCNGYNHFGYLKKASIPKKGTFTVITRPQNDSSGTLFTAKKGETIDVDSSPSPDQAATPKPQCISSFGSTKKKLQLSCEKESPAKDAPLNDAPVLNDVPVVKGTPPMKDATEGALPYSGKKRGRKVGDGKKLEITVAEWWDVCANYRKSKLNMSQTAFLRSTHTSEKFTGNKSQQQSFSRNLKKYDTGSWRPTKKFKTHKRLYVPLEDKLIKYLEARGQKFKRDKLGVSWNWLKVKCNEWAQQMDLKGFKCSDGWLHSTLKMHGFEHTKLHGEAEDMSEELRHSLMEPWRKNFHELIEELGCEMEHVYNADQTGLFYQKLPNGTYLRKGAKRTARGTKGMTDKARITLMICTSAAGRRVPIAVVGKSKKPVCFNLVDKVPLPYVNQSNAWFTAEITVWWISPQ